MRKFIGLVLFIILISFSILEIRKNHESSETQMEIERAKEMSDIKTNIFNAYNNKVICQSKRTKVYLTFLSDFTVANYRPYVIDYNGFVIHFVKDNKEISSFITFVNPFGDYMYEAKYNDDIIRKEVIRQSISFCNQNLY